MTGMSLKNLDTPAEREARKLIAQAHERELEPHLTKLEAGFAAWRAGTLTGAALTDRVNSFHDGPARSLHKRYVDENVMNALAHGVLAGVIQKSEIPVEMRDEVGVAITLLKFMK
jgi:hypothetical protein